MSRPERLLIFGDSLSDSGDAYALSGAVVKVPIPPASAGYNGWFSNGLIQSEVTADLLGADARQLRRRRRARRRVADRGRVSRARTTTTRRRSCCRTRTRRRSPPTPTSAGSSGATSPTPRPIRPTAGTAAAIWIGANDYNGLLPTPRRRTCRRRSPPSSAPPSPPPAAIALTGVEHILVYNLPEPDFLPGPLPRGLRAGGGRCTTPASAQGVALLAEPGGRRRDRRHEPDQRRDHADPRTFGLNPAYMDQPLLLGIGSQPTWDPVAQNWVIPANPAVAGVDPDRVAFIDFLHPSSATHGVLGSFAAASIAGNPVFGGDGDETIRTGAQRRPGAGRRRQRPGPLAGRRRHRARRARRRLRLRRDRAATSSPAAPATTGCTAASATTWWRAPTATTSQSAAAGAT